MQAMVYSPAMQGTGEFDGGKIREQKPIGFPGEGSVIKRVGPLFYWAWATASADGRIGLHPHQGFEILTYVVEGSGFHGDTLGNESEVGPGGAQVMRTGSGVSHRERLSPGSELFQIWFEPDLKEAVRKTPTYGKYGHEEFPQAQGDAVSRVKTILGEGSPIRLTAEAGMKDVEIGVGGRYRQKVAGGCTLTALAIRGGGSWVNSGAFGESVAFRHQDFIVAAAGEETEVEIANTGEGPLRLILIQVPTTVKYPLYPKR